LAEARFLYTRPAEQELRNDGISKPEVENMLRRCRVTLVEPSGLEEMLLRAEGTDADGRPITAVVVLREETVVIKVITGWARK
jgi:hypothetical protein